jgi:hypothetical protein
MLKYLKQLSVNKFFSMSLGITSGFYALAFGPWQRRGRSGEASDELSGEGSDFGGVGLFVH